MWVPGATPTTTLASAHRRRAIPTAYISMEGSGGFIDITESAFGDAVNTRSATSIACADVNGDGWLDLYIGNIQDDDFRTFSDYNHPGHYNLLYPETTVTSHSRKSPTMPALKVPR